MMKSIGVGSTQAAARVGWPAWIGWLTGLFSLVYGVLGLYWSFGGPGFPFGLGDPGAELSPLAGATPQFGGPVIAVLGLLGAALAVATACDGVPSALRVPALMFGWTVTLALGVLIPDYRVLMMVAYAPICLLGAPFGWPPVDYFAHLNWPTVNLLLLTLGGLLWMLTTLSYQRRSRQACGNCGRRDGASTLWTTPAAAAKWGRWAVYVAVAVPVLYDLTRWAWALGWPLGITREFWEEGQRQGVWLAGAALGLVGLGGAILTHGLVQRWGEVFPRWMLGVAGKRVPIMLAVVPAAVVAVIVTSAGVMVVRMLFIHGLSMQMWATVGPMVLWPIWGVSLAAAALGYHFRRRGTCQRCGRG